jgi:REP element-mobilizing transposase RayT
VVKRTQQLKLDLRERARWGGRRKGAGRKPGPNPRNQHQKRSPLAARFPCHVTLKIRRGIPSLRALAIVRELERSLRAACERGRFRVAHYSIQDDHLHLIVEAANAFDLACGMKSIGARLGRAVNRIFRRRGPVLADRYHRHVLRTPREVRRALAYVLLNARRHLAKRLRSRALTRSVRLDPASSARWFQGWLRAPGGSVPPRALDLPAVSRPRTWLLRVGWRRWGLLDPAEVPGGGA